MADIEEKKSLRKESGKWMGRLLDGETCVVCWVAQGIQRIFDTSMKAPVLLNSNVKAPKLQEYSETAPELQNSSVNPSES